jgi:hypothetical protein
LEEYSYFKPYLKKALRKLKSCTKFSVNFISSVFGKSTYILFEGRALAAAVLPSSRKGEVGSESFVNLVDLGLKHQEENFELFGHEKNAYHK